MHKTAYAVIRTWTINETTASSNTRITHRLKRLIEIILSSNDIADNAHYVRTGGAWDSGKMKASIILSSIFQELDPLNVRRNGNILQVGGSVKMVKAWNPWADDHVLLMPKGIKFDGYQRNFTLCTNDRTLLMSARDNTDYIQFNSSGSVGDWAVGTYFYAQSTWIIKD